MSVFVEMFMYNCPHHVFRHHVFPPPRIPSPRISPTTYSVTTYFPHHVFRHHVFPPPRIPSPRISPTTYSVTTYFLHHVSRYSPCDHDDDCDRRAAAGTIRPRYVNATILHIYIYICAYKHYNIRISTDECIPCDMV